MQAKATSHAAGAPPGGLVKSMALLDAFETKATACLKRIDGTLQRPCSASDLIADRDELLAQLDDLEEVLRAARLDKLYHAGGASGDASTGADQAIKTVKDDLKETKKDIRLMAGAAKAALVVLRRGFSQRRGGPGDRKQTPRGRAGNGRVVATAMVVDR